jgi:AcrR family transcriptional regulator
MQLERLGPVANIYSNIMTSQHLPYKFDKIEQRIVETTIELICKYGVDPLSFKQIATLSKVNTATVINIFFSLENLLAICIKKCFYEMGKFIALKRDKSGKAFRNIEELWRMLIEFNSKYSCKSVVIFNYFETPDLFPSIGIRQSLLTLLDYEFDGIEHKLKHSNSQIRFIVFIYLFRMAKQIAEKLSAFDSDNQGKILGYFYQTAERELNRLLFLPIC